MIPGHLMRRRTFDRAIVDSSHCLSLPEGIIMNPIINPIAMSVISIFHINHHVNPIINHYIHWVCLSVYPVSPNVYPLVIKHGNGKSPNWMEVWLGKSPISMVIFQHTMFHYWRVHIMCLDRLSITGYLLSSLTHINHCQSHYKPLHHIPRDPIPLWHDENRGSKKTLSSWDCDYPQKVFLDP